MLLNSLNIIKEAWARSLKLCTSYNHSTDASFQNLVTKFKSWRKQFSEWNNMWNVQILKIQVSTINFIQWKSVIQDFLIKTLEESLPGRDKGHTLNVHYVGNRAKGRITCAYQRVRNVLFSENLACFVSL